MMNSTAYAYDMLSDSASVSAPFGYWVQPRETSERKTKSGDSEVRSAVIDASPGGLEGSPSPPNPLKLMLYATDSKDEGVVWGGEGGRWLLLDSAEQAISASYSV